MNLISFINEPHVNLIQALLLKFRPAKEKKKYELTDRVPIPGTDLKGVDLLQKSLGVDKAISRYLFGDKEKEAEGVVDSKGREWTEREFKKTQYMWRTPGLPTTAPGENARLIGENNLVFSMYAKYVK